MCLGLAGCHSVQSCYRGEGTGLEERGETVILDLLELPEGMAYIHRGIKTDLDRYLVLSVTKYHLNLELIVSCS